MQIALHLVSAFIAVTPLWIATIRIVLRHERTASPTDLDDSVDELVIAVVTSAVLGVASVGAAIANTFLHPHRREQARLRAAAARSAPA